MVIGMTKPPIDKHYSEGDRSLSERVVGWYWVSAFTLAAMGATILFCSSQISSSDAYIGYVLGPLLLLTAGAIYFWKLHRE
jgi:hypothetical protein